MSTESLNDIIKQAEALTPDEQLRLIAHLAERARTAYVPGKLRRRWREVGGAAEYPLLGEDAQDWVSRSRLESDTRSEGNQHED